MGREAGRVRAASRAGGVLAALALLLTAVVVLSARAPAAQASSVTAWAVGASGNGATSLIEQWTGSAWVIQPSPSPGTSENDLHAAAATSSLNAWAVGARSDGGPEQTFIVHWNGVKWKVQTSPNAGSSSASNILEAVAATSTKNAWAVGYYEDGGASMTLILHWDGSSWEIQPTPSPGSGHRDQLYGVTAISDTNAWAVGSFDDGSTTQTLVLHWNGLKWKVQPSANATTNTLNELSGVGAASAKAAWAVGDYDNGTKNQSLIIHWNGSAWKVQDSPNVSGANYDELNGVAATSASNAWAIGEYSTGKNQSQVLRWNGTAWKKQTVPQVSGVYNNPYAIAATSATNAWVVGNLSGGSSQTLVLHWNGVKWKIQTSPNVGTESGLEGIAAITT